MLKKSNANRLRKRRPSIWPPVWLTRRAGTRIPAARPLTLSGLAKRPGWKIYQNRLNRKAMRRRSSRKLTRYAFFLFFAAMAVAVVTGKSLNSAVCDPSLNRPEAIIAGNASAAEAPSPVPPRASVPVKKTSGLLSKGEARTLLDSRLFVNLMDPNVGFEMDGRRFYVRTSIQPRLQTFMMNQMETRHSRYIGMVVMNPRTGRILGMTSYDRENPRNNPCINNVFPAASIFKIVTAAAAIESCAMTPDSTVTYTGGKHTLYKSQIEKESRRKPSLISLKDSFAQSVNPVFGRIGVHCLGRDALLASAKTFGFNRKILFDIPLHPSCFILSDDEFQWAEAASGFNRTTAISPLHGAMLAASVVGGDGRLVEPSIVERISDDQGRSIYRRQGRRLNQVMTPKVMAAMKTMMEETVKTGTSRKAFRGYENDPILSRLVIGGKTGSINDRPRQDQKYDWFVGFAEEAGGKESIALAILIVHEKYIGTKSNQYARMIIEEYFREYFRQKELRCQRPESVPVN